MRTIIIALLLVILPAEAMADPAIVTFPPGTDKIVALKKGQEAPYDGQLFDTPTSIRWGNWLEQYQLRLKIDVEAEKKISVAQIEYMNELLKIERKQYETVTKNYQVRIVELEKKLNEPRPWYKSGVFQFTMGAVCMAGVFALSTWAISSTE